MDLCQSVTEKAPRSIHSISPSHQKISSIPFRQSVFLDLPLEIQNLVLDHLSDDAAFIFDLRFSSTATVPEVYLSEQGSKTFCAVARVCREIHDKLYRQIAFRHYLATPVVCLPDNLEQVSPRVWKVLSCYPRLRIAPSLVYDASSRMDQVGKYSQTTEAADFF